MTNPDGAHRLGRPGLVVVSGVLGWDDIAGHHVTGYRVSPSTGVSAALPAPRAESRRSHRGMSTQAQITTIAT